MIESFPAARVTVLVERAGYPTEKLVFPAVAGLIDIESTYSDYDEFSLETLVLQSDVLKAYRLTFHNPLADEEDHTMYKYVDYTVLDD